MEGDDYLALAKENSYSLADLLEMEEERPIELIEGEPVMQAAPSRIHQLICRRLVLQLGDFLEDKTCELYFAPFTVRLFQEEHDLPEDVDTVVEPDIAVICDHSKLDDIGCKGAPDLIIEILSPSTQRHDRIVKYGLYQRAGVREYWIVDPSTRTVQVCTLEDGKYYAPQVYTAESVIESDVLNPCCIDLSKVFREII